MLTLAGTMHAFSPMGADGLIVAGRIFTGFLLTSGLYLCYRQRFTRGLPRGVKLLWILVLNIVFSIFGAAVWQILYNMGFHEIPQEAPLVSFTITRIYSLILWNITYFGIELILGYHAVRLESAEAREVARTAELKQLQSQLNPHFLFNALNMVMANLESEHKCRDIMKNLAEYLRFSLHEARTLEPLSRELDALECYLELQRVRFQDGLHCGISCTPEAMRVPVPPMLVQPLLENAFKYGPLSSPTPLRVEVEAAVVSGWLKIRVSNSGDWVPPGAGNSSGIGLANIRRRLFLLCGESASLETETVAGTVRVEIRIPAKSKA